MMMRSIPPASAHLALIPVPAPPPMIGLPAATWARRRRRHSSRVKKLMMVPRVVDGFYTESSGKARRTSCQLVRHDDPNNATLSGPGKLAPCPTGKPTMPVILLGTLDTKGVEFQYVRDLLQQQGVATLVVDAGSQGAPVFPPDVPRDRVFEAAG